MYNISVAFSVSKVERIRGCDIKNLGGGGLTYVQLYHLQMDTWHWSSSLPSDVVHINIWTLQRDTGISNKSEFPLMIGFVVVIDGK